MWLISMPSPWEARAGPHKRSPNRDAYLTSRLHRYSRKEVQNIIASGRVFLRGRSAKPASRVAAGETIIICYPRREEPPCLHETLPILYEDEYILAVNKPGDLLSHPTDQILLNSVTSILSRQFKGRSLHLVHRLDRETSGVLLFAKNPDSARALSDQFSQRLIEKEYLAIVSGAVSWKEIKVDLPLGKEGLEIKVRQTAGQGLPAITEFHRQDANQGFSLVRALPKTGRLHQIRVHLAQMGHPVLGDKLYTGKGEIYMKAVRKEMGLKDLQFLGAKRQMLHSWKLTMRHPKSEQKTALVAPLPQDFLECLKQHALSIPEIPHYDQAKN